MLIRLHVVDCELSVKHVGSNSTPRGCMSNTPTMDLNISVENCGPRDSEQVIRHKLDRCKALGFHTVALSVTIEIKNSSPVVPKPPDVSSYNVCNLKILTRLTVKVSESLQLYKLGKCKETSMYDLLALEPQNHNILQYICVGSAELDILTFDLSDRLDYNLFKVGYKVLEDKGVCVEINYGQAQLGSALRRNIICNGQNLTEKTTKNIILSSGIDDAFRFRGPKDVTSLGPLFLLTTSTSHAAVYVNASKAINQAKHRANPASSAIELIKG